MGATPTPQARNHYEVVNSYFAGNTKLTGTGALEHDSARRNYLHPIAGSEAATIGAGLFTKPAA